jgi:hypothetical protein
MVCLTLLLTEYTDWQAFLLVVRIAWAPPPPHPQRVLLPPFGAKRGRYTRLRGRGWGTQFDDGTDIVILKVHHNPFMLLLNSKYCIIE